MLTYVKICERISEMYATLHISIMQPNLCNPDYATCKQMRTCEACEKMRLRIGLDTTRKMLHDTASRTMQHPNAKPSRMLTRMFKRCEREDMRDNASYVSYAEQCERRAM